jgi:hypothetical protein
VTDQEFAAGVDLIIATERGHACHRALDQLWTRYAVLKGGTIADATLKWMAAIEGAHSDAKPYVVPAPSRWGGKWLPDELNDAATLRLAGRTWREIGHALGRSGSATKKAVQRATP